MPVAEERNGVGIFPQCVAKAKVVSSVREDEERLLALELARLRVAQDEVGELYLVNIPVATEKVIAIHFLVPHFLELDAPGTPPETREVAHKGMILPVRPDFLVHVAAVEPFVVAGHKQLDRTSAFAEHLLEELTVEFELAVSGTMSGIAQMQKRVNVPFLEQLERIAHVVERHRPIQRLPIPFDHQMRIGENAEDEIWLL